MRRPASLVILALLLIVACGVETAAQDRAKEPPKDTKPGVARPEPKETLSTTRHSLTVGTTKLDYEATAGTLILKDDNGKPKASMFFVAYTRTDLKDTTNRPLTFSFNGGPGSSSVWLHLGSFGPKRVALDENAKTLAPPYRLVDNEATLLDVTDLVFIDPVSTGFSRPAPGQDAKQFHGVQEDVDSVGSFIRLYTTKFKRWDSPKFLAGESYGTTRAAGLSGYLQDHEGMNLNGIILVSVVLNFATLRFEEGNDLPYILYLPAYTATAWYHKKLSSELMGDLNKTLAEVEKFAVGEYTAALMKGNALPDDERQQVVRKVARYTGLGEEYVSRSNLRIEATRFRKELLRSERKTLGRYDSRFQGADLDAAGDRPEYDPSYAAVQGPFTALMNRYLSTELKYENDGDYRILTDKVQPWNYGNAKNRYLNVAPTLRKAMTSNPGLRLFVASGNYDLATPFSATQYTLNHLDLQRSLAARITHERYPAGHMMYIDHGSLVKLKKDLAKFIQGSLTVSSRAKE